MRNNRLPLAKMIDEIRRKSKAGEYEVPPDEADLLPVVAGRVSQRLQSSLGGRYKPEKVSLATYQVYHKDQKVVHERVIGILEKLPDFIEQGRNIVWFGSVGTGKDHMCASLLYAAAQLGFEVDWRNVQRINEESRDRMKKNTLEKAFVRELVSPIVLALSDPIPPSGSLTDWNRNLLYRVIDERGRNLRATWVTLNVSTKAAAEDEIIDALSMQVWDRMREKAELLPCFWPSFRGRK